MISIHPRPAPGFSVCNMSTDSAPLSAVSAPGYLIARKHEVGLWDRYPLPADAVWPGDPDHLAHN